MTDHGKIDAALFDRVIAPNLGAAREDVTIGPTPGIDFGALDLGSQTLVGATDPLSVLPELGLERAGRLAIDIVLADVAVSGIEPSHLTLALTLPETFTADELAETWKGIGAHAATFDVAILDVHIGRYPSVNSSWIGSGTAFGLGDQADIVRPDGAQPGDAIVISTGPAAEVAGLFATLYPESLGLDPETVALAQERVDDIFAVGDALAAHDAGRITAMHDATEGGIAGGLVEMATGAGVRFDIEREAVPVADGVTAVCDAIDVDPWHVTSCGSLLMTAPRADADAVVSALAEHDTTAAIVGTVGDGDGVYVDGARVEPPDRDPSWAAAERLQSE